MSFPAFMFPGSAVFHAPGSGSEQRGDPVVGGEAGGTTLPCYAEPDLRGLGRNEAHLSPEGRQRWFVYTGTDPGASTDWRVVWSGRELRATARSAAQDGWALWRTECEEVT